MLKQVGISRRFGDVWCLFMYAFCVSMWFVVFVCCLHSQIQQRVRVQGLCILCVCCECLCVFSLCAGGCAERILRGYCCNGEILTHVARQKRETHLARQTHFKSDTFKLLSVSVSLFNQILSGSVRKWLKRYFVVWFGCKSNSMGELRGKVGWRRWGKSVCVYGIGGSGVYVWWRGNVQNVYTKNNTTIHTTDGI